MAQINIKQELKERLVKHGVYGDTVGDIITKLLDVYEKKKKK